MNDGKVSVLMSVYDGETVSNLNTALKSIKKQSYIPDEVIIVKDGALKKELDDAVSDFAASFENVNIVPLKKNRGLGIALAAGLRACSHEFVARMDSDDISLFERFKIQREFLLKHKDISALGSDISEFIDEDHILRTKRMPATYEQLYRYGRFRNPLNHMSVMFRRADILKVGGYIHFPGLEDYHLWCRLLAGGFKIANTKMVLIYARLGNSLDFSKRRGGIRYFMQYLRLRFFQLSIGYTNLFEFIGGSFLSSVICLIPATFRNVVYKVLRK